MAVEVEFNKRTGHGLIGRESFNNAFVEARIEIGISMNQLVIIMKDMVATEVGEERQEMLNNGRADGHDEDESVEKIMDGVEVGEPKLM